MTPTELKVTRERLGLSQKQLANTLGVHRVSVVRWETGFHKVPPMLVLAMKELERQYIDSKMEDTSRKPILENDQRPS